MVKLGRDFFEKGGGTFVTTFDQLTERCQSIKAYLFDWDGVFNNGYKSATHQSGFSEADSMGLNLLRFSSRMKGGTIPPVSIITGEKNETCEQFARREHLNSVYMSFKNKKVAFSEFLKANNLQSKEVCFMFDDVADLAVAFECGLRIMVKRPGTSLLMQHAIDEALADYLTGADGAHHAVREACELIIGIQSDLAKVINGRVSFSDEYGNYLSERNQISTEIFHSS